MALPRVGRFTVIEAIGEGSSEFAAYDPDLDRRVTIRVLRSDDEVGLAAARSVSRLVHRNIEAIHQVGQQDELAYVAAEHVPEGPLDVWASEQDSSAVARCLRRAAEGLRTAHEAGVVHGRITCESIRVGDHGDPKLVGFGLATDNDTQADDRAGLYAAFRTAVGDVALPAWLSGPLEREPELVAVERELAEHLDRPRTFNGQSIVLLGIAAGVVLLAWPRDGGEPAEMGEPCTDGTEALVEVWGPARQQAIKDAIAATGERGHPLLWEQVRTRFGAWSDAWSEAHLAACEATRVLETQSEEVYQQRALCLSQLRDQAGVLSDALVAVDSASVVDLTSKAYRLPKVSRCQTHPGSELGVDLTSPDASKVVGDIGMAKAKKQVSRFEEAEALLVDAGERAEKAELWYLAADAHRELATFADRRGELEQAQALAEETLAHAERSGVPNEIVWAWHRLAEIALHRRDADKAAFNLERATSLAEGYDVGEDVWVGLLTLRGQIRFGAGEPGKAADDFLAAAKLVDRLEMDPALGVQARYDAIAPLVHAGRMEEARSVGDAGLERADQAFGPGHMLASGLRLQLAQLAMQTGDLERGLALSKQLLEDLVPSHPYYPQIRLGGVGVHAHILNRMGRGEEAIAPLRAALEELEPKVGSGSPILTTVQTFLADILVDHGEAAEAVTLLEGVVSAAVAHPLTDPMNLAAYQLALANAQAEAGQPDAAAQTVEAALASTLEGTAEHSNSRFATLVDAGETLMKVGKRKRAREVFLQARPIMEATEVDPVNKQIVIDGLAELGETDEQQRAATSSN